jgi:ABC-type cobalamin/Fe3+-siderophores transport system ATPase subunit
MTRLAKYAPIETLALPQIGSLDCSGLIVIVGPNSSGKSQLLRDIHLRVTGEPRVLVVADEIRVKQLPYESLLRDLTEEGFTR